MPHAALALVSLLLASACAASAPLTATAVQEPSFGRPFTLAPGASATVGADRVVVRFERVASDSRCPKDVQCITAGEAVVRVSVEVPGMRGAEVELSTDTERASAAVGDYRLTLTDLAPVPSASTPTPEADYRATFVLVR